jgi:hypothetical protein
VNILIDSRKAEGDIIGFKSETMPPEKERAGS